MPLDEDVKRELDSIRNELRDELRAARTPREREHVRSEARADLDDVLRSEGYRLTRRELDAMIADRDAEALSAAVAAELDRRAAEAAAAEEEAEEEENGGDPKKSAAKRKPAGAAAGKKPAGTGDGETEEEWT